jgi:hypothetical protein
MVLADLGRKLNNALSALNKAPVVDEKVFSALHPQTAPKIDTILAK